VKTEKSNQEVSPNQEKAWSHNRKYPSDSWKKKTQENVQYRHGEEKKKNLPLFWIRSRKESYRSKGRKFLLVLFCISILEERKKGKRKKKV